MNKQTMAEHVRWKLTSRGATAVNSLGRVSQVPGILTSDESRSDGIRSAAKQLPPLRGSGIRVRDRYPGLHPRLSTATASRLQCHHITARVSTDQTRHGFTLIEMVLVLVVMTILATVALEMIEPRIDQQRFDATRTLLTNIRTAIIGDDRARAPDGSRSVSGFVADIGRPPLALEELFQTPDAAIVPACTSATPAGDHEVRVYGGWNGPYLQLPIGATTLTDSWATGLQTFTSLGVPSDVDEEVAIIRSNGRDGLSATETGYDANLTVVMAATQAAVDNGIVTESDIQNQWQQDLTVHVFFEDATQNPDATNGAKVVLRVYGPRMEDPATPQKISVGTIEQHVEDVDGSPITVVFDDLFIGPRVIRAYQLPVEPGDEDELSDNPSVTAVSTPTRVIVSRETNSIQLILRLK